MTNESKNQIERGPVVAVVGHIDHGKSTLLDYIRKSNTVDNEAGGITQHISAYEVTHKAKDGSDKKITFLDTPGHESFGSMRSKGTGVADIAVLVIAADDSVKEQTKEALSMIRKSETPFIVAVNKIDKPGADKEKTLNDMAEHEVFFEGRGGGTSYVPVSAKTGEGVDELIDMILLTAEVEELRADPSVPAQGVVVEAHRDKQKGVSATVIIKNGSLEKGVFVATAGAVSPVRMMEDSFGKQVDSATFSSPIHIVGWNNLPETGSVFKSFASKKDAEKYSNSPSGETQSENGTVPEEDQEGVATIPVVVRADTAGTIDAVLYELAKLESDRVKLKILNSKVGNLSENDVRTVGGDIRGLLIGFNVGIDPGVMESAERAGLDVKTFDIIYELAEWVGEVIIKRTPKMEVEEIRGKATILKTFSATKKSQVVGGRVESGTISVGDKVQILRRDEKIGIGKIRELQVHKSPAKDVAEGNEFGMNLETSVSVSPKDSIESFVIVTK